MKLVTFLNQDNQERAGVLLEADQKIIDLRASNEMNGGELNPAFLSVLALIEGGETALDAAKLEIDAPHADAIIDVGAITLCSPIPRPPQIRDCLCFEDHLTQAYEVLRKVKAAGEPDPEAALKQYEEQGLYRIPEVWYQQPIYYKGNRYSVIGTGQDVIWPAYANIMDFELEFGFYIGKGGRDIARENALDHIFGYTIFNDISARDTQAVEMQGGLGPAKGKDFDTGNIIGPCIVTADEIDPYDLTMIARVNGEEWSRGSSSTMHWKFEDLISYVSQSETLHPGEFFGSGTVGGGSGLELERYLEPGDVVELEVEGIGTLRNRIVKQN
ncbi:MAG: fumarylacetoacetate hydrolase family protein [Rhodospirillaceae bacterium]|jgi:2-keto-4-pentenoate hydratase/2-oxohepta-3-ene-1,7-dioic acid hydratase in catechol pathway|nr:fumarylacetoacetate hydrolase family protein [Rhodospirillaceae bacterium]MBT4940853.1 fumarylacetoacetate hydrolase family protein [Rhodospirillaceae bacterium]MBT5939969.1 fumarylacetoacetate hydrolase family protein [Rhodospirillaceae bacterium]MBT7267134.1 fumarylacetoacetate hydrolase family protein [Rhodospirillaceae bacterium]